MTKMKTADLDARPGIRRSPLKDVGEGKFVSAKHKAPVRPKMRGKIIKKASPEIVGHKTVASKKRPKKTAKKTIKVSKETSPNILGFDPKMIYTKSLNLSTTKVMLFLSIRFYQRSITSKYFQQTLCNNNEFWRQKMYRDYPYFLKDQEQFLKWNESKNFKKIYLKTKNAIFRAPDFENFFNKSTAKWTSIQDINVDVFFLYKSDYMRFILQPNFGPFLGDPDDDFADYFSDKIAAAGKVLKSLYAKRHGSSNGDIDEESRSDYYDSYYSSGFRGSDIFELFEPLLLMKFDEYDIKMEFDNEILKKRSKVSVETSADT